jgi:RNA polymerase sigma-70 factor (ECF subfamily)
MLRLIREQAAASDTGTHDAETAQRQVGALYEQYGEEFLHYALALAHDEELARDALQESFMRYFVALCRGDEIGVPRAWIYRVLHNYLLDRIKEARSRSECHLRARWCDSRHQDIEGQCFRGEFLRLIRSVLTAREYDCVRLRTQGLRYQEIAATMDLTSGTVGTMMHRAIRKLRSVMIPERSKA